MHLTRRAVPLLAAGFLLAACGGSVRVVHSSPPLARLVPPSPTSLRFSAASNRGFARHDVQKLLRIVVLPSSARQVANIPASAPKPFRDDWRTTAHLDGSATAHRFWVVGEPVGRVMAYLQANAPSRPRPEVPFRKAGAGIAASRDRTVFFPPAPGRSWARWLNVAMTTLPGGKTVVVARAEDDWLQTPPQNTELPKGIERIDIASRFGGPRPNVLVHVRDRFKVATIVAETNGLGLVPADTICALDAVPGPAVTFRFRAADGRVIARVEASDPLGSGRSGPCNPLQLTIGNRKAQYLIGSDLLLRIQQLLGVDLAPPVPREVSSCLRAHGFAVSNARGFTTSKSGRRWTVTFHADGKVTLDKPAPHELRRCLNPWPHAVFYG